MSGTPDAGYGDDSAPRGGRDYAPPAEHSHFNSIGHARPQLQEQRGYAPSSSAYGGHNVGQAVYVPPAPGPYSHNNSHQPPSQQQQQQQAHHVTGDQSGPARSQQQQHQSHSRHLLAPEAATTSQQQHHHHAHHRQHPAHSNVFLDHQPAAPYNANNNSLYSAPSPPQDLFFDNGSMLRDPDYDQDQEDKVSALAEVAALRCYCAVHCDQACLRRRLASGRAARAAWCVLPGRRARVRVRMRVCARACISGWGIGVEPQCHPEPRATAQWVTGSGGQARCVSVVGVRRQTC